MKISAKDIDLIKRYFTQDLSFEELMEFDNKRFENDAFNEQVEMYEQIESIFQEAPELEAVSNDTRLEEIANKELPHAPVIPLVPKKDAQKKRIRILSSIAATIALLVIGYTSNQSIQQYTYTGMTKQTISSFLDGTLDDPYSQTASIKKNLENLDNPPGPPTRIENEDELGADKLYSEAMFALKKGNYQKAKKYLTKLSTIPETSSDNDNEVSSGFLNTPESESSTPARRQLFSINSSFEQKVDWYLFLIELDNRNLEDVEIQLTEIINNNAMASSIQKEAEKLRKKIRNKRMQKLARIYEKVF